MKLTQKNHSYLYGKGPKKKTFGIFSIDSKESVNLGNRLIEHAIIKTLNLGEPKIRVSMFKIPSNQEIEELNKCGFVLLPGSTILASGAGQGEALECLKKINAPKFCVAASGWSPYREPNIDAIKRITPPIGCRDPQIMSVCENLGIESMLVGCPTAYLPEEDSTIPEIPFKIAGFARDCIDWQIGFFANIHGKMVASIQEPYFEKPIAKRFTDNMFDYSDPKNVMNYYGRCSAVITGRLHGILPAMSQKKPVFFFGHQSDSRFTLLNHLGIPVQSMRGNPEIKYVEPETYGKRVKELSQAYDLWAKKTVDLIYDRSMP